MKPNPRERTHPDYHINRVLEAAPKLALEKKARPKKRKRSNPKPQPKKAKKVAKSSRYRKPFRRRKSSKDNEEAEFEEEDDDNPSGVRQFFDEEAKEVDAYDESEDEDTGSMDDFIVDDDVVEYNSSAEESSCNEEPSRRSNTDLKWRKRIIDDDDEEDDGKQPTEHLMEAVERDEQELEEAKYFIDNSSIDNHEPVNHCDTSLVAGIDHGRSSLDCRRRSRKRQKRQEALADVRERRIQQMNCSNNDCFNTNSNNVFGSNNLINKGTINIYTIPQPHQSSSVHQTSQVQQVESQVVTSLVSTTSTRPSPSLTMIDASSSVVRSQQTPLTVTANIVFRKREAQENVWMRPSITRKDCLEELQRQAAADTSGNTNSWRNNFINYFNIVRRNGLTVGDRCHNIDDTVNQWVRRVSDVGRFTSYSDVQRALLLRFGFYPSS